MKVNPKATWDEFQPLIVGAEQHFIATGEEPEPYYSEGDSDSGDDEEEGSEENAQDPSQEKEVEAQDPPLQDPPMK